MQTCRTSIRPACGIWVGNYTGENTNNHALIAERKLGLFRKSRSVKVSEETLVLSELNEMDAPKHGDFIFHLLPHRASTMTWKFMKNISAHNDDEQRPLGGERIAMSCGAGNWEERLLIYQQAMVLYQHKKWRKQYKPDRRLDRWEHGYKTCLRYSK